MIIPLKIRIDNERLNSWLVILFAFFFPIVALLNYFFNIQSGALSQIYRGVNLILSLFVIGFVVIRFSEYKKLKLHPGLFFFIAFWIIFIFRLIIDLEIINIHKGGFFSKSYYYSFALGVTFFPALAASLLKPFNYNYFINDLKKVLIIFNLMIALLYVKELILSGGSSSRFSLQKGEIDFLNPITIGTYAGILFLICVFSPKKKISDYFFLFIASVNILAVASKGPILFLIFVVGIASVKNLHLFFKNKLDFILKLFLGSTLLLLGFIFSPNMVILNRFLNYEADQSSSIRKAILSDAMEQFASSPIFGSHFLVFKSKFYSHNIIIDILLSNGVIGMLILLPIFVIFFTLLIKNQFKSIVLLIILFLFLCANTSGSVYNSNEFWIIMAVLIANQHQFLNYSDSSQSSINKLRNT
jgi:hypothetical protein